MRKKCHIKKQRVCGLKCISYKRQPHATNLDNGSIRKPQKVAVEFAESIQMNGVD